MSRAAVLGVLILVGAAQPVGSGLIADRATLNAILGAGAVTEDFESYAIVPGGLDVVDTPLLDSTTIVDGQGPGLVQPGATYVSGSGDTGFGANGDKFIWMGDGREGLVTKTLAAFIDHVVPTTMTIEYDPPVSAMGLDLLDFGGFSHTTTVSVFDAGGALLNSFDLFIDGPTAVFFGYEADAIGSVHLTGHADGTNTWSTIIDNHTYGVRREVWAVNEPGVTDSELVTMGLDSGVVTVVSPVHVDADIEAMCYFGDQVVGAKGERNGGADLVTMDFQTGAITFLAHIDFGGLGTEIVGMATDGNGVHWGYFEGVGFATIEVTGNVGSFNVEIGCDAIVALNIECFLIEGLAVSLDGETLYAMVRDGRIVEIDVATGNAQVLADFRGQFTDIDIENLELTSNHELAFITEDAGHLYLSTLDVNSGEVISTEAFSVVGLEDVETLIFPASVDRATLVGGCSYAEGACDQLTLGSCAAVNGQYHGDFSDCPSPCPADLISDGNVGVMDILVLLAVWGTHSRSADLDGDGIVGAGDCLSMLAAWGPCPNSPSHNSDVQNNFNTRPKRGAELSGPS
jgi:hypothetical protein